MEGVSKVLFLGLSAASVPFIYFGTLFIFIDHWFGLWSASGIINGCAFTAFGILFLYSYVRVMFTDPGRVPASFVPDIHDPDITIQETKRKGGDLRYCKKCSLYKPPRTHHCRMCNRCVLRMDHHCIWINNCVGHANYKFFFTTVFYATIAIIYSLVLLVGSLTTESESGREHLINKHLTRNAYIFSGILLVILCICFTGLLAWHIYLILHNKTTIEDFEGSRGRLAGQRSFVHTNPYDLGPYENVKAILGPNVLYWLCPCSTRNHIGCGLRFRTTFDQKFRQHCP